MPFRAYAGANPYNLYGISTFRQGATVKTIAAYKGLIPLTPHYKF